MLAPVKAQEEFVHAITTSFIADMERLPQLQSTIREGRLSKEGLVRLINEDMDRKLTGDTSEPMFPNIRKIFDIGGDVEIIARGSGMGSWVGDAVGAVGALAGAWIGYQGLKEQVSGIKAQTQAEQQMAETRAQIAALQAQGQYATAERVARESARTGDGMPGWVIPAVLGGGALLVVGYLLMR